MNATRRLLSQQQRQPLIKFLGKRSIPSKIDHAPHQHPASTTELPKSFTAYSNDATKPANSFAEYRSTAQQHGPIGQRTGRSLGGVDPEPGVFFDKSQLGAKYSKIPWTAAEMEAIESGGASMWA